MKNYLISVSLLLAISSTAFAVELKYICPTDVFAYDDFVVNSVHFLNKNVTLNSVGWFVIDQYEEFSEFTNPLKNIMMDIKKEHNKRMVKVYSERFLNSITNATQLYLMNNETIDLFNRVHRIYMDSTGRVEEKAKSIRAIIERGKHLIEYLISFYEQKLPQINQQIPNQPEKFDLMADLKLKIENMTITDDQNFAFINNPITEIYEKAILTKPNFTLIRASKNFYDFRSTGFLRFNIVLPFFDHNYNKYNRQYNCLKANELPKFYQDKPREF